MKSLHKIAFIILVIGGLNWLLAAFLPSYEVGTLLGGMDGAVAKIIYLLVGLSAIYEVVTHKGNCKECSGKSSASAAMGGTNS